MESSWKRKFDDDFDRKCSALPFLCTKETKLQTMQWKILHHIYPSNILLEKMKIKDSDKCEWCGVIDTSIHFFFECSIVKVIWKEIEKLIFSKTGHTVHLTAKSVLLGITHNKNYGKQKSNIINLLILIGKHTISKGKYGKLKNLSIILEHELLIRKLN